MRGISRNKAIGVLATTALTGALAVSLAGVAGAEQARGGGNDGPATVRAKIDGQNLVFAGANRVEQGARLRFVNRTDPQQVGPHTFSLVRKSELPETRRQQRRCFRGDNVCARIAEAHRVDFATGDVNRPVVERGQGGWDKRFGNVGDSFFTEERGEEHTRRVSAEADGNLWFLCAIHPDMQKRVHVVE